MQAAITATEAPEYDAIYSLDDGSFDSTAMSLWANGIYEECPQFDLIADCAIYMAAGNITYEVGVIKPKKAEDTEKIEEIFENRKKTIASGGKAAYDPNFSKIMDESEIFTDGDYVFLLITDNNASAKEAINNLKKAE